MSQPPFRPPVYSPNYGYAAPPQYYGPPTFYPHSHLPPHPHPQYPPQYYQPPLPPYPVNPTQQHSPQSQQQTNNQSTPLPTPPHFVTLPLIPSPTTQPQAYEMLNVKLIFGSERHHFQALPNFDELTKQTSNFVSSRPHVLKYRDDAGDFVSIRTQDDLDEAVALMKSQHSRALRLECVFLDVPASEQSASEPKPNRKCHGKHREHHWHAHKEENNDAVTKADMLRVLSDHRDQLVSSIVDGVVAKLPPAAPSKCPASREPTGPVHSRVICNICDKQIVGFRYNCTRCADFDLCERCERSGAHDPTHILFKIRQPTLQDPASQCSRVAGKSNKQHPVHCGIRCDSCQHAIKGIRFKCTICDDFDLCEQCDERNLTVGAHQPEHVMIKIPTPYRGVSVTTINVDEKQEPRATETQVPTPAQPSASTVVHRGIFCDGCKNGIVGIRYKCANCMDYDLCERCEANDVHSHTGHLFIKVRRHIMSYFPRHSPVLAAPPPGAVAEPTYVHPRRQCPMMQRHGAPYADICRAVASQKEAAKAATPQPEKPFTLQDLSTAIEQLNVRPEVQRQASPVSPSATTSSTSTASVPATPATPATPLVVAVGDQSEPASTIIQVHPNVPSRPQSQIALEQYSQFTQEQEFMQVQQSLSEVQPIARPEPVAQQEQKVQMEAGAPVTSPMTPTTRPTPVPMSPPLIKYECSFVDDLTFQDNEIVQPGLIVKQWRMRNPGPASWPEDTQLCFISGNLQGYASEVQVPLLAPNEEGTFSVALNVPKAGGQYMSIWQLCSGKQFFGHRIWCSVTVQEPASPLSASVQQHDHQAEQQVEHLEDQRAVSVSSDDLSDFVVVRRGASEGTATPDASALNTVQVEADDQDSNDGDSFSSFAEDTLEELAQSMMEEEPDLETQEAVRANERLVAELEEQRQRAAEDRRIKQEQEQDQEKEQKQVQEQAEREARAQRDFEQEAAWRADQQRQEAEFHAQQAREQVEAEAQMTAQLKNEEKARHQASRQREEEDTRTASPASLRERSMAMLISMGFADRRMNAALLDRFHGDVQQVVNHLLQQSNDGWWSTRH